MQHVGICERCGVEKKYEYKSFVKRFCSHSCSNAWKWEQGIRKKPELVEIKCMNCGISVFKAESFLRQHPDTKFCSKKCASSYKSSNSGAHTSVICSNCGIQFIKRTGHITDNNYCSKFCSGQSKRKKYSKWKDSEFVKEYMKNYSEKNKERKNYLQRIRNKTEKGRTEKTVIRIARRGAGVLTKEQYKSLIDDSRGICYLCNNKIIGTPQIEHILPISRGGKTELGNLSVACSKCNQSKGSKTLEEFLLGKSRKSDLTPI